MRSTLCLEESRLLRVGLHTLAVDFGSVMGYACTRSILVTDTVPHGPRSRSLGSGGRVRFPGCPRNPDEWLDKPRGQDYSPGMATVTRRYADLLLDGGLDAFVSSRRAEGRAWRLISRDIWEATDGELDVSYETLRAWFLEVA